MSKKRIVITENSANAHRILAFMRESQIKMKAELDKRILQIFKSKNNDTTDQKTSDDSNNTIK
jgi:hypothetical protein